MDIRSGGPSHEKRLADARLPQFRRHIAHLLKRRGNQTAQTYEIHIFGLSHLHNPLRRSHHSQVNYLEIVAGEHHSHDILAYVVHISFHSCQQVLTHRRHSGIGIADKRLEYVHRPFHSPRCLDHLRQEHLPLGKQIPHRGHSLHQWSLDNLLG